MKSDGQHDGRQSRVRTVGVVLAVVVVVALMALSINRKNQQGALPVAVEPTPSSTTDAASPASQPSRISFPNKFISIDLIDDPGTDGWDTEKFTHLAEAQLHHIKQMLLDAATLDEAHIRPLIDDGFTCDALRPAKLQSVYEGGGISIERAAGKGAAHRGAAGFAQALRDLAQDANYAESHISHVKKLDRGVQTTVTLTLAGAGKEIHTQWQCTWRHAPPEAPDSPDAPDSPPRLMSIKVDDYEQSARDSALFTDVTGSVLGANRSYGQQLLFGTNHWAQRLDLSMGVTLYSYIGAAVGDVNGDGLDDVYYCEHGGLPNRLYVQNPDGSATDRSAEAGVDFLDPSRHALLIDLDNDGDQDLAASIRNTFATFTNDGSGKFTRKSTATGSHELGMLAACDFDNDGDLDVYICRYYGRDSALEGIPRPVPYHDANNGGRNVLFRNDGDWIFTDVTEQVGLNVNNTRFSLAASWEDIDNDGDQDLYVANDFGRNCLYRNDGGVFVEMAEQAGVQDIAAGMSVSFSDYNRDGLMDIYVSNMYSNAGNRITFQRQFQQDTGSQTRWMYQRHARGNTLFENAGDGTFRDVSLAANVNMGRWAWSSRMVDINNDGLDDVVIGNGQMTNDLADDL